MSSCDALKSQGPKIPVVYDAFISYSHEGEQELARALHAGLHRFAKPLFKLRALHLFRDESNLAVNPTLWKTIADCLNRSDSSSTVETVL